MRISDWSSDVCSSDLIQDKPGGQCAELYPEKPIYDIPALPVVTGGELVDRLLKQAEPFEPVFHLGQMAEKLERLDNGHWLMTTDQGQAIEAPVIVIAAGGGSFVPKRDRKSTRLNSSH